MSRSLEVNLCGLRQLQCGPCHQGSNERVLTLPELRMPSSVTLYCYVAILPYYRFSNVRNVNIFKVTGWSEATVTSNISLTYIITAFTQHSNVSKVIGSLFAVGERAVSGQCPKQLNKIHGKSQVKMAKERRLTAAPIYRRNHHGESEPGPWVKWG